MKWQAQTRAWLEKRRIENVEVCLAFFDRAFAAPLKLYPRDAWFGIHDTYASLTLGNMWLACIGTLPQCAYVMVEPTFEMRGMGSIPIRSTQRYAPLVLLTAKPLTLLSRLNENQRVWDSYARACELILQSPISRNVITRNLHRKARLSELQ